MFLILIGSQNPYEQSLFYVKIASDRILNINPNIGEIVKGTASCTINSEKSDKNKIVLNIENSTTSTPWSNIDLIPLSIKEWDIDVSYEYLQ